MKPSASSESERRIDPGIADKGPRPKDILSIPATREASTSERRIDRGMARTKGPREAERIEDSERRLASEGPPEGGGRIDPPGIARGRPKALRPSGLL